ncbi:MAG: hypothetical protein K2Q26_08255 [Bdellovibrionales bacterium]|nr:hypothetical protein [Bdellovibrionales bacterium]
MFKSLFKRHFKTMIGLSLVGLLSGSCAPKDDEDDNVEDVCMQSGDILVTNSGTRAVLVLDALGNYKRVAFNLNNSSETVYGIGWLAGNEEFAVAVDGADRIVAVNRTDCSSRNLITDGNLTGNIRGLTQLNNGDILVIETNNVERFTSAGLRITSGGWPRALQNGGTQLSALPAGGFVHCSLTSDVVRTYNDAGTQIATRASGIAGTTDATGCLVMSNGSIATAWSGTTDSIIVYSSNLATAQATFSNPSILGAPGGIAQRADGNLLVVDRIFNYIVELTSEGVYVGVLGQGILSTPEFLLVVP